MKILENISQEERKKYKQQLAKLLCSERLRPSTAIPDETDGRSAFDSDFSRVALAASVRRLQDKTQVFPLPEYDFVRNRLTHSIEVMTIARGLGLGVEKILKENNLYDVELEMKDRHVIAEILATAALVHDIGNPPFGHAVEKAVQKYFNEICSPFVKNNFDKLSNEQKEDFKNIEGNSQGFRTLCRLGLSVDEYSFNLTVPVLATIVKYPCSSLEVDRERKVHERSKLGYLQSEKKKYQDICEKLGLLPNQRHPLTYLLEAADDIAYSVCDIEDGYKNGIIKIDEVINIFAEGGINDDNISKAFDNLKNAKNEFEKQCYFQTLRIALQSKMIIECTRCFLNNYDKIIVGNFHDELILLSCGGIKKCCDTISKKIIADAEINSKEQEGKDAAIYLLEGFLSAILLLDDREDDDALHATPEYKLYSKISVNYRHVACEEGRNIPTDKYKMFLLATDYIFGMTDNFLLDMANDREIRDLILRVQCKVDILENPPLSLKNKILQFIKNF